MMDDDEQPRHSKDPQTGKVWELIPEEKLDIVLASISIIYLIFMLIFFSWLLVDAWLEKYTLVLLVGDFPPKRLASPFFQLAIYSVIGGGLGGIVNGFRSILHWHCELRAFGRRFIWKYILLPLLGAILGLFVFALILGGIAVFAGDFSKGGTSDKQIVAMFAIGALAGFGSRNVFKWLDDKVAKFFKTEATETEPKTIKSESVPNLIGMTKDEATNALNTTNLVLGNVTEKPDIDVTKHGKVIDQDPKQGSAVAVDTPINISIGAKVI